MVRVQARRNGAGAIWGSRYRQRKVAAGANQPRVQVTAVQRSEHEAEVAVEPVRPERDPAVAPLKDP